MRVETLDLHGLSAEEALAKTERQLAWVISHRVAVLVIIHGKGHHNINRIAVIKQALRKQLKNHELIAAEGYAVVYGESDAPVALAYDEGATLVVQKAYLNEYTGGKAWQEKNEPRYEERSKKPRKKMPRKRRG